MANFNLNDYVDVQTRITTFWQEYPDGAIRTQHASDPADFSTCRYRAEVYKHRENPHPDATGYAFEIAGQGMANKTSHEENAETSAIGRALANMGYATSGKDRPSRQEMSKTQAPQAPQRPQNAPQATNTTPTTSAPQHSAGMRRIHALGNQYGFTHDELRLLCDREEYLANKRRIVSMSDAPEALLIHVAKLIETKPLEQRVWLDERAKQQQAELMPDMNTLPNPNPSRHLA